MASLIGILFPSPRLCQLYVNGKVLSYITYLCFMLIEFW
jgi:hypothetical protein